ncbi:ammonium transporter 1 member 2-like [Dorcoceras hygrometricum]|uniref:Ammonium transporter 1 member 2-like n=1 Tax=Dorcoceras hygrometricum TaxID=472368 RepID=A0A2Z7B3N3_9LAMI|nr:ammonium transporter 1 member 2-like [Dorcoceras hygrometricum]
MISRSLSAAALYSLRKISSNDKITNRTKTLQNDTVPTYRLSAAALYSLRKISSNDKITNRTKTLQNDTVPTYQNDAVANTSCQQFSQAKQPRADNSYLFKTIYLLVARNHSKRRRIY